ncbi:hypothetical protein N865_01390 [Intrasporangium oryzae NRRL B-24470]|uniref:Uncharacterized protein n=1 Tax=Intrasporangium oryzae NRRL B-24470 TaxID=1386089 RepID=W9G6T6_9MICO|nr:hypothetical protein N865_01390 [Intrasporangium oryzae NRRL B-24470]
MLLLALGAISANDGVRGWVSQKWSLLLTGLAMALFVAVAVSILNEWPMARRMSAKGTVIVVTGLTLIALFLASVIVMPTRWQLVTLRSVVLVVLILFPTVMWWLFLASKRASLLNEFLSDLRRLGVLEPVDPVGRESVEMQQTRVRSYLQKFEASYGTLRTTVHEDVLSGHPRPYASDDKASSQQPLVTAAVPIYFNVVVLAVGWLVTLPPLENYPHSPTQPRWLLALAPNVTPATAAFMGAYFFSIQMLFRRFVRADLRGSAYIAVSLRVILAMLGVWTIQAVATTMGVNSDALVLLGFAVGVFPYVAWQVIRAWTSRLFKASLPTLETRLPLDNLDGVTVWHQARLEEEDVENVPNMATVDIVDLLVNTRFPASRIVDWVDQALLLTALGPNDAKFVDQKAGASVPQNLRQQLARYGIRTASSLVLAAGPTVKETPWAEHTDLDLRARAVAKAVTTTSNYPLVLSWRRLRPVGT